MPSLKFCGECNNLLYPKSDNEHKILLYQCRNCNYQENAVAEPGMAPRVYKNDLVTVSREQPGETRDLETDPTLQRSNIQCPKCGNEGAVFFQDQGRRITTNMTLFFACTAPKCGHVFRDPAAARR